MSDRFSNRVTLVTGGARGIGREIARHLAKEGAAIAIADLAEEDGQAVVRELGLAGANAAFFNVNANSRDACASAIAEIMSRFGRIDLLVNNIGIAKAKPFLETAESDWFAAVDSNLYTTMRFCHLVLPHMVEQKFGRILNMSSVAGRNPRPNAIPYAVAKAGIIALTRSLAQGFADHNIRVNALAPATIDTEVAKKAKAEDPVFREFADNLTKQIVLKRWGEPSEVARAALFLLSEEASYITGQTLSVDGGSSML